MCRAILARVKRALVPLLLATALALAGGLWLAQRDPGEARPSAPPTAPPAPARSEPAHDIAAPADASVEQRAEVEGQPAERAPTTPLVEERAVRAGVAVEPGSIEVTVVGPSGEPVPGASVRAEGATGGALGRPRVFPGPATDARGRARISSVPPGSVRVVARAAELAAGISAPVRLTAGRPGARVEIALTRGGSVEGELTDVHGQPAVGIRLSIHLRAWPGQVGRTTTGYLQTAEVGAEGSFRFEHLPPGNYTLQTRAGGEDQKRVPSQHVELEVSEGRTTRALFGDLRGTYVELFGLVLRDGGPVDGADVSIHWADRRRGYLGRKAKTDAEGRFEVTLDEGGDYRFQISDHALGASVFHEATVPASPVHELVIAYSTGRISGRVFGPGGRPVAGIELQAIGRPGGEKAGSSVASTATNAAGEYEFPRLLAATYRVSAGRDPLRGRARARVDPYLGTAQISGLRLGPGEDLSGTDLRLPAAAVLEGFVIDREGAPAASAEVQCVRPEHRTYHKATRGRTDDTGRFLIGGMEPGEYRVRAIWKRDISPWVQVSMKARETARADLALEPGTMLTVEVRDGGGAVEKCYVRITDAQGFLVGSAVLRDGATTLGPLFPGTYRALATTGSGGPESEQGIATAGEPAQTVRLSLP